VTPSGSPAASPTAATPAAARAVAADASPSPAAVWGAARGPVLVGGLILLGSLLLALLTAGGPAGLLDPRAPDRSGAKATAALLRDQGVRVNLVQTTDAAVAAADADTTLLVTFSERLGRAQLRRLRDTAADLVVVAPSIDALHVLTPELAGEGTAPVEEREPACESVLAGRAGSAELGGALYTAEAAAEGEAVLCYATGGAAPLVVLHTPGRSRAVVGTATPFTNDRLDDAGNAALALGLLGIRERLAWYLPSIGDPDALAGAGGRRDLVELIPAGVIAGALQALVAVVLLALWRARRLGPVVAEPLPVVVRAAEAVEGRARLYRRARARPSASAALREATRTRLVVALGLPAAAAPAAVVDAVARRAGRPPGTVADLLYGGPPTDDSALVRLADRLDATEREVRRP
jgi:hypothetical protein